MQSCQSSYVVTTERNHELTGGEGHRNITPTKRSFVEADGTDVRLDRVRVFDLLGKLVKSYLQDPMGRRFVDNLPDSEDDLEYIRSLPREAKK